jgi:hypothetical protein
LYLELKLAGSEIEAGRQRVPNWFVLLAGVEVGPLTDTQLRQLAASGKMSPTDQVRTDASPTFRRASEVRGLWAPPSQASASTATQPSTAEGRPLTFGGWYREHPGKWPIPLQVVAWLFYGFLWIPGWWALSLQRAGNLKDKARGRKILMAVAATAVVLMIGGLTAGRVDRNSSRRLRRQPSSATPAAKATTTLTAAELTVDQFRQQVQSRDFSPKSTFYVRFGKPKRIMTIGDEVHLIYDCSDGVAKVQCVLGSFQFQDTIATMFVDQIY